MFLFCSRRRKNYYDFFPHKYGNFSLLLYQDWERLIDLGYLLKKNDLQLSDVRPYLEQLQPEDRSALNALVSEIGNLRGDKLIRKVYLEFPYYASRSEIVEKILKDDEKHLKDFSQNKDNPCFFTIGYEDLSIDAFLNILISDNISALVDVRKNPISMKYGFSKARFANYTKIAGLSYFHIPELGIPSNLRRDLKSAVAYQRLFEFYATDILPNQTEALEKLKKIMKAQNRVAITCFEADYHFCHRHKIAEYIEQEPSLNVPVIHLHKDCTYTNSLMFTTNKLGPQSLWDTPDG